MSNSDRLRPLLVEYLKRWEISHGPMWMFHIINLGLAGYLFLQVAEMKGVDPAEVAPAADLLTALVYVPVAIWYGVPLLTMVLARVFPRLDKEWSDLLPEEQAQEVENEK